MYPQCPDGSCVNIPAIETSVLPPLDSYLDRDNNIPPEDGDQPPPPLPAEIDPIWWNQGAFWPYVPGTYDESGGFDSQPPSQPPSPGLSYCTPRTPSSRHRSATPSHHSSGNTGSCHDSSWGDLHATARGLCAKGSQKTSLTTKPCSLRIEASCSHLVERAWSFDERLGLPDFIVMPASFITDDLMLLLSLMLMTVSSLARTNQMFSNWNFSLWRSGNAET